MNDGMNEMIQKIMKEQKNGNLRDENTMNRFLSSNLRESQAEQLKNILSDENKLKSILESDKAKEIMRKLTGGDSSGGI